MANNVVLVGCARSLAVVLDPSNVRDATFYCGELLATKAALRSRAPIWSIGARRNISLLIVMRTAAR